MLCFQCERKKCHEKMSRKKQCFQYVDKKKCHEKMFVTKNVIFSVCAEKTSRKKVCHEKHHRKYNANVCAEKISRKI